MNSTEKGIIYSSKEYYARMIIKIVAIITSVYGIIRTVSGWMSFTYFTILSNIFIDIVLAIFMLYDIKIYRNGRIKSICNTLYTIKFMATISITLTFLVYMFILVPTYDGGIFKAYFGNGAGSLGVHFICPILAIIDFCLFDYEYDSNKRHAILAVVPPLVYVMFVVIASQLGLRWEDKMYAPYNFLNYGAKTGWFGFDLSQMSWESLGIGVFYMIIGILPIFIGIGRLFLWLKNKRKKTMT